jgi:hypothetical protein
MTVSPKCSVGQWRRRRRPDPRLAQQMTEEHLMRPLRAIAARAWIGLAGLGVLTILLSLLDLAGDLSVGLPSDHRAAFLSLAGSVWTTHASGPGAYVTVLEEGYAIHELAFGLLLLLVAAIPLRLGRRWAWVACWTLPLAIVGYATLIGSHDATILRYAVAELVVFLVFILAAVPAVFVPRPAFERITPEQVA